LLLKSAQNDLGFLLLDYSSGGIMSLVSIEDDESIFSFIYRLYLLNGVKKFDHLVNLKGFFIFPARVEFGTEYLFKKVNESQILQALEDSNRIINQGFDVNTFNHPFGLIEELKDFYHLSEKQDIVFGRLVSRERYSVVIKVCLDCIADSLKTNGFGYHKLEWLFEKKCHKHKKPLIIINEGTRMRTVKQLKLALAGKYGSDEDSNGQKIDHLFYTRNLASKKKAAELS
tara:strand:+ start:566 stop:1252 length:687 start_codon:yes stop_codon:yes gene_type:complete